MTRSDVRKGRFWLYFIVGQLTLLMGGLIYMVYVSVNDPSFSVEPNFYKKAIGYDREMEQARKNVALGWRAEVAELAGGRIVVRVLDGAGAPVDGGKVALEAFPVARGSELRQLELAPEAGGRYAGAFANARPGIWELRLDVAARGERFTSVLREELRLAGAKR